MNFQLPAYVLTVLEQLNKNGFEACVVGGCVRDMLLGLVPGDFDVCTGATPEEIQTCFADYRTIPTGIKHGTVTVISGGHPVEITTYRVDGTYSDSRHPDGVRFTSSLQEDLARRDFTVNAMAYHPKRGLVDLYGGRKDLKAKIIRCVGEPELRLTEDALRILRGLRFASTLDFSLEPTLVCAMEKLADTLHKVAMERIFGEFTKLLCGKGVSRILQEYQNILAPLFTLDSTSFSLLEFLPAIPVFRYAALLKNHNLPAVFLKNLRAPNDLIYQVETLVVLQNREPPESLLETRKWFCEYGIESVNQALILFESRGVDTKTFQECISRIQEDRLCCSLKELAIKGQDLLALGFPPGKELGEALNALLLAVMQEKVENQKEALLTFVKTLL